GEERLLNKLGYRLSQTLGEGSFSNAKATTFNKYKCPLTVKVMDQQQMSPDIVQEFLPQEVSIMHKIWHPNTMHIFEVAEVCNGKLYIMMEAADTDLLQMVQETLPCVLEVWDIFVQVARAVQYLHNRNLMHWDLKCENVLLTTDGCWTKLSDFRFSKETSGSLDVSNTFCMSAAYAALELV
ncbi:TSSK6 kinase, partial [Urocolius indicus]|nr:TSSK6 kinase [Urocolius indicus]